MPKLATPSAHILLDVILQIAWTYTHKHIHQPDQQYSRRSHLFPLPSLARLPALFSLLCTSIFTQRLLRRSVPGWASCCQPLRLEGGHNPAMTAILSGACGSSRRIN